MKEKERISITIDLVYLIKRTNQTGVLLILISNFDLAERVNI